jgi:MAST domain-containing protein
MKYISLITLGVMSVFLVGVTSASSPYGSINTYYNDKLLPGKEVAKPLLKIGEPFKVKFEFRVYQKSYVSVKLSELQENDFIIVSGPTLEMEEYYGKILEENSTEIFEWTVKPTEKWAGGSIPIDFVYQVDELGAGGKTLVNGGFTVAYCTISNEYYEGEAPTSEAPTSEEKPVTETESSVKSEPVSSSASASAFSLAGTVSVLALAFAFFRNCKL